jgi:hexosaminidase
MNKSFPLLLLPFFCIVVFSGLQAQSPSASRYDIIPYPVVVKQEKGNFILNEQVYVDYRDPKLRSLCDYTSSAVKGLTRIQLRDGVRRGAGERPIRLVIDPLAKTPAEGYSLEVRAQQISIRARTEQGLFYGVQSLLQLIPINGKTMIPCVTIEDHPRFAWRGLMLDVSRHFFTVADIKKMIDEMAVYKLNLLHLHLSDDQGWRVEIKDKPELTKTGAWRVPRTGLWWDRDPPKDGEPATDGGFYTRDQVRDIVAYAAQHFIRVMPEIDVPGHSLAAIAAYPDLSCTKLPYKVNPGSRFNGEDNALCPGQEATFEYLDKVFTEIAALFPFEYIHIGGDECNKSFWKKCPACQKRMAENNLKDEKELQSYFIKRVEKILQSKGKKLLGWDEILEGGLAPEAAVMSWHGMKGGIAAAQAKHKVVMSPTDFAYLDFYQGDAAIEPPTYAMLRLKTAYTFEPVPDNVDSAYILGGQGNLWTESVPTWRHAEYMFWPRALALSEVLWSPKSPKNWTDFLRRVETQFRRFDKEDVNYARSVYDAIILPARGQKGDLLIKLDTEVDGLELYYTFDDTYPDRHSALYKKGETLTVPADAEMFRVVTCRNGQIAGRIITVPLADLLKRTE